MSDREFETYLSLVGRLLRLSRSQREAIGEELRDHFESRLAELLDRGLSHTEAARVALEEFGDAAGLATHLSRIAQTRKRRIIMRCTVGSIAAVAAALILGLSIWPDSNAPKLIGNAVADGTDRPHAEADQKDLTAKLVKVAQDLPDELTVQAEAALNQRMSFDFTGQPLSEILVYVCAKLNDSRESTDPNSKVQVHFDGPALKDAGIDPVACLVTLKLRGRANMVLDLILRDFNLGYTVREGILFITTRQQLDNSLETRVYDCREILAADTGEFPMHKSREQKTHIEAGVEPQPNPFMPARDRGGPSTQQSIKGGGGTTTVKDEPRTPADDLIDVITTSVADQTWRCQGGPGTICEYDGLFVVNATSAVQTKVADLLDKLSTRLAARLPK